MDNGQTIRCVPVHGMIKIAKIHSLEIRIFVYVDGEGGEGETSNES